MTFCPKGRRFAHSLIGSFWRNTSIGVFPWRVLWGTLFLVYAIASEALSQSPFGSPVLINAVRLISRIVRLALSIIALVSECLGMVGLSVISRCWSSIFSSWLRNSPPQSACILLRWRLVAASISLITFINAFPVSFLAHNGIAVIYLLWSSMILSRYLYSLDRVDGLIGPIKSACILSINWVLRDS